MKDYESPVIFDNEELAEGVYATGSGGAGAGCYTVTGVTHQNNSDNGRCDDRFQINAHHSGDHMSYHQLFVVEFDKTVSFVSCESGTLYDGVSTGTTLKIQKSYTNNPSDNIGLGGLIVAATDGAECSIKNISILCEGAGEFVAI